MSGLSVQTIDLLFQGAPGVIASYVLDCGDGLVLVDCGPTSTLSALEAGLQRLGASLSDVRHLLLTHIHFDHAGAAGTILERVPQARAYVHERGAPHMISPERLYASATQIYGDQMDRLWGEMKPIPAERLTVLAGGESFKVGRLDVQAYYTPGHAVHHLAYRIAQHLFTGDVGGVRLDARQTPRAPTPPPDINLEVWRESIATLRDLPVETLHLTHFGSYPNQPQHWNDLLRLMELDAARVQERLQAGLDFQGIAEQFRPLIMDELAQEGADLPARFDFACPPWMSVQGLMRYWTKKAVRASEAKG